MFALQGREADDFADRVGRIVATDGQDGDAVAAGDEVAGFLHDARGDRAPDGWGVEFDLRTKKTNVHEFKGSRVQGFNGLTVLGQRRWFGNF
jgi:hypothetical protein